MVVLLFCPLVHSTDGASNLIKASNMILIFVSISISPSTYRQFACHFQNWDFPKLASGSDFIPFSVLQTENSHWKPLFWPCTRKVLSVLSVSTYFKNHLKQLKRPCKSANWLCNWWDTQVSRAPRYIVTFLCILSPDERLFWQLPFRSTSLIWHLVSALRLQISKRSGYYVFLINIRAWWNVCLVGKLMRRGQ